MRSISLCIIALAFAALWSPTSGQSYGTPETVERSGGWFGLGLGVGSSSLSCQICVQDRRTGPTVVVSGGLALNPRIRLGLELAGWAKFDEVDQYLGRVTPVVYFFPDPSKGILLRAGPSVSFFSARDQEGTEVGATSFGVLIGVGYEIPLSESTALMPSLDLMATSFGSLTSGGREITGGAGVTLIHLGIGIMFP